MESIKVKVQRRLDEDGVSLNAQCFDGWFDGDFMNPFCGLETEYLQRKFYKEHFGLLVSFLVAIEHVILGKPKIISTGSSITHANIYGNKQCMANCTARQPNFNVKKHSNILKIYSI